jgi:hypothetical protein
MTLLSLVLGWHPVIQETLGFSEFPLIKAFDLLD